MAVKLHRCSAMWVKMDAHPCGRVQKALDEQGIEYEVVKGPLRPGKRNELQQLSGQRKYPAIEFEDGSVYREESKDMAAKIRAGQLFDESASPRPRLVAKLGFQISVSLDGFVAGPNPSEEHPLGEGGEQLHEWVVELAAWRKPHGREGGEVNASSAVFERRSSNIGATIMGRKHVRRRSRALGRGSLGGLVGRRAALPPPGLRPHPPSSASRWRRRAAPRFTFVTDGIESALEQAKQAAGGQGRRARRRRRGHPAVPGRRAGRRDAAQRRAGPARRRRRASSRASGRRRRASSRSRRSTRRASRTSSTARRG